MSEVYPWIGFKKREDRERFRHRIFSEQKKRKPSISNDLSSRVMDSSSRMMTDKEIWDMLDIHVVHYGNGTTFYLLSDVVKFPNKYYWLCFRGNWDLLEELEKIIEKGYKDYIYLVAH